MSGIRPRSSLLSSFVFLWFRIVGRGQGLVNRHALSTLRGGGFSWGAPEVKHSALTSVALLPRLLRRCAAATAVASPQSATHPPSSLRTPKPRRNRFIGNSLQHFSPCPPTSSWNSSSSSSSGSNRRPPSAAVPPGSSGRPGAAELPTGKVTTTTTATATISAKESTLAVLRT